MLKETLLSFINDEALSRGAAIAFYTVTSIAPVLLIVIAIAGLAFGRDASENAITEQLSGLMGQQTAEVLQTAVRSASNTSSGVIATIIGVITLIVTASGVFGEMQTALNAIWKAKPKGTTVSRLIRARAASLGLVAVLGFLLMVSLVVSTMLTAFGNYLDSILPFGKVKPRGLSSLARQADFCGAHPRSGNHAPKVGIIGSQREPRCVMETHSSPASAGLFIHGTTNAAPSS